MCRREAPDIKHQVHLRGPKAVDGQLSAIVLGELVRLLVEGSRRALRQRVEGRSVAAGAGPAWLDSAADFVVLGIRSGSSILEIEAPSLADAAPSKFQQADFFMPIDPSRSALGLFEESLDHALAGREAGDDLDDGLLSVQSDFSWLFEHGIESMQLRSEGEPRETCLDLSAVSVQRIKALRKKTPKPRAVRVSGKLDTIGHTSRFFRLVLQGGQTLHGIAFDLPEEQLQDSWGKDVTISGRAFFRPDGSTQRVEAEHLEPAGKDASLWSEIPQPLEMAIDVRSLRVAQGPKSGINAFIGSWPGDETDEEIVALLAETS